jgi:ABC-type amino acid transport substrate-binding protein
MTSQSALDGRITGFLVDVLHRLAIDLSIPETAITFVETDWQNFGQGLSQGKYDLSVADEQHGGAAREPAQNLVLSVQHMPLPHNIVLGRNSVFMQTDFLR